MGYELVIEGNVFHKGGLVKACIGIGEGKVQVVKKVLKGERHVDVGDKLVLPGAIDPHVHFRDPGFPEKEDFPSGSLAAAFGGVTTVLDMPNTRPAVTTADRLRDKFEAIKGRSHVDYGLFCGLGPRTVVEKAVPLASGFKIYLGETTGDMMVSDQALLRDALGKMAAAKAPVTVHCEDPAHGPGGSGGGGSRPRSPADFGRARPEAMETATVKALVVLEEARAANVNIAHVSSLATVEAIPDGLTCEVTAHHMLLHDGMPLGARGKMNPPLRSKATADRLWQALMKGDIDMLASDHAPHTAEEKEAPFHEAPAGVPGVETLMPLVLARTKEPASLKRAIEAATERPSQVFGLSGKGAIGPGMDADVMVVDLRARRPVKGSRLHSRCGWTPFEGEEAVFPRHVLLRGEWLIEDWEKVGDLGWGRPLKDGVPGRPRTG